MNPPRVLVLGGSTESSALAARLCAAGGVAVTTSLAGRTASPSALPGEVRIGGFGGSAGLARWLEAERVEAVVDATHPFTGRMPWNAAEACAAQGVPRLRLRRPGWAPEAGDRWTVAADMKTAVAVVAAMPARRVFLTIGRQQLEEFAGLEHVWFLVRSIEPPDPMPLHQAEVLLSRGPFALAGEEELMRSRRIEAVVTKNSGGSAAAAKLTAARRLGIPVVMVARPPAPPGPCVATVDDALSWLASTLGHPAGPDQGGPDQAGPDQAGPAASTSARTGSSEPGPAG
jgi:precorrin-6A/cobalt-precorrin-6A reductase